MKKTITYPITLSKVFPITHPRHGQPTNFREKFDNRTKLHTIRANYAFWKDRFAYISKCNAVLSIRQWSTKPYCSKQEIIINLDINSKIGIEELVFVDGEINKPHIITSKNQLIPVSVFELSNFDGLSVDDWLAWFKGYNLNQSMAIVHFTAFRYT